ncbi:MAG: hypothetical protein JSV19_02520, partial [Phycisphaerales bacterium]
MCTSKMTPVLLMMVSGVLLAGMTARAQTIWYVDDSATDGLNDGTSWADAFLEVQSALAVVQPGDEIWVAHGTYQPYYDDSSNGQYGERGAPLVPCVFSTFPYPPSQEFEERIDAREHLAERRRYVTEQPRTFDNEVFFMNVAGEVVRSDRFTIRSSDLFGDFDGDGDVDLTDYGVFEICLDFSGPGVATVPACDVFDSDSDSDIDLLDAAAFTLAFTGPLSQLLVEAGELFPATCTTDSYYSGEPGTAGNNALNGTAAQASYTQDDFWYAWTVDSTPVDSGPIVISNAALPATAYMILPTVRTGDYVFRLTVTNLITGESAFDTVTLDMDAPLVATIEGCPGQSVEDGSIVTLTAVTNRENEVLSYDWSVTGPSTFAGPNGLPTMDVAAATGVSTVTVEVTEGTDTATSDPCTFTVLPATIFDIAAVDPIQFEGDSGPTTYSFTVTRAYGDLTLWAQVDWAVAGGGTDPADPLDFMGAVFPSGTAAFVPDDAEETITVEVAGDTTIEPDETFTVTISNPLIGVLGTDSVTATIMDDDTTADPVITLPTGAAATVGQNSLIEGISVSDADNTTLTVNMVTGDGFISFAFAPACTAVDGDGNPVVAANVLKDEYTLSGTIVTINQTLAGFQFTSDRPVSNPGTDQVDFTATDGDGGVGTGTLDIAVGTLFTLTPGDDTGANFTGTAGGDVFLDAGPGNFGQNDQLVGGAGPDMVEIQLAGAGPYPNVVGGTSFSATGIETLWFNGTTA